MSRDTSRQILCCHVPSADLDALHAAYEECRADLDVTALMVAVDRACADEARNMGCDEETLDSLMSALAESREILEAAKVRLRIAAKAHREAETGYAQTYGKRTCTCNGCLGHGYAHKR